MPDVGAVIAVRIGLARADILGIGIAEDLDQPVFVVPLLVRQVALELLQGVLVLAQPLRVAVGVVVDRDGVVKRLFRALIDLLEMGLPGADLRQDRCRRARLP